MSAFAVKVVRTTVNVESKLPNVIFFIESPPPFELGCAEYRAGVAESNPSPRELRNYIHRSSIF